MIKLPKIGVGCAALSISSPETCDIDIERMFEYLLEIGISYFDVAPLYGGGRGELLLGKAISRIKQSVAISTKVGYVGEMPFGGRQLPIDRQKKFSKSSINTSILKSLERLGTNYIDIVYLHDPSEHFDTAIGEAFETLVDLKEKGIIGAIGVGTTSAELASNIIQRIPIQALLLAGQYTLIDQSGRMLLNSLLNSNISVVIGGIFNSGILASDDARKNKLFNYSPASMEVLNFVEKIKLTCSGFGVPLKAAALQFPSTHSATSTTLLGPRTLKEFQELYKLLEFQIPNSLWVRLKMDYSGN